MVYRSPAMSEPSEPTAPEPTSASKHAAAGRAILIAMVLGALWGLLAREITDGQVYVGFLGTVFKASLKMLIVPLVLASIVTGITSLGDVRKLGRLGLRTLGLYAVTTGIAVVLGLVLVNTIGPGRSGEAGETLEITLEVSQGRPNTLRKLARAEAESGRTESARALLDLFLQRYGDRVPAAERVEVTNARDSFPPPPPYRVEQRRQEAAVRWAAEIGQNAEPMTVREFLHAQIGKIFKNPFEALAGADVLAIIVFALFLGGCLTTLGEQGEPLIRVFEALNAAMMVLTELIMVYLAPMGVFGLMAEVVAELGFDVLAILAKYMITVILGLGIHGFVVLPTILRMLTGMGLLEFLQGARPAMAVALSTSSSSATLPVSIDVAESDLGCDPRHAGFVLPLGATVNMDGTALYEAVAALFIAQIYGADLGFTQQVLVALTATLAAIGAAGIPSAGTVTMVMVLNAANLPLEGIALILAVDRVLDMCRTMVNVMGDLVVAVCVDRIEKRAGALA